MSQAISRITQNRNPNSVTLPSINQPSIQQQTNKNQGKASNQQQQVFPGAQLQGQQHLQQLHQNNFQPIANTSTLGVFGPQASLQHAITQSQRMVNSKNQARRKISVTTSQNGPPASSAMQSSSSPQQVTAVSSQQKHHANTITKKKTSKLNMLEISPQQSIGGSAVRTKSIKMQQINQRDFLFAPDYASQHQIIHTQPDQSGTRQHQQQFQLTSTMQQYQQQPAETYQNFHNVQVSAFPGDIRLHNLNMSQGKSKNNSTAAATSQSIHHNKQQYMEHPANSIGSTINNNNNSSHSKFQEQQFNQAFAYTGEIDQQHMKQSAKQGSTMVFQTPGNNNREANNYNISHQSGKATSQNFFSPPNLPQAVSASAQKQASTLKLTAQPKSTHLLTSSSSSTKQKVDREGAQILTSPISTQGKGAQIRSHTSGQSNSHVNQINSNMFHNGANIKAQQQRKDLSPLEQSDFCYVTAKGGTHLYQVGQKQTTTNPQILVVPQNMITFTQQNPQHSLTLQDQSSSSEQMHPSSNQHPPQVLIVKQHVKKNGGEKAAAISGAMTLSSNIRDATSSSSIGNGLGVPVQPHPSQLILSSPSAAPTGFLPTQASTSSGQHQQFYITNAQGQQRLVQIVKVAHHGGGSGNSGGHNNSEDMQLQLLEEARVRGDHHNNNEHGNEDEMLTHQFVGNQMPDNLPQTSYYLGIPQSKSNNKQMSSQSINQMKESDMGLFLGDSDRQVKSSCAKSCSDRQRDDDDRNNSNSQSGDGRSQKNETPTSQQRDMRHPPRQRKSADKQNSSRIVISQQMMLEGRSYKEDLLLDGEDVVKRRRERDLSQGTEKLSRSPSMHDKVNLTVGALDTTIQHHPHALTAKKQVQSRRYKKMSMHDVSESLQPAGGADQLSSLNAAEEEQQQHQQYQQENDESGSDLSRGDNQSHCSEGLFNNVGGSTAQFREASDLDSEGYMSEGSYIGAGANRNFFGDKKDIDGISEHASDELTSDSEELFDQGAACAKNKRDKVDKTGEKVKKKKKVKDAEKGTTAVKKKDKQEKIVTKKDKNDKGQKASNAPQKQSKQVSTAQGQTEKKQKTKKEEISKEPKKGKKEDKVDGEKPKKKKKGESTQLKDIYPTNSEEQYEIFMQNNCEIDPQFEYENPDAAKNMVSQIKPPSGEYFELSKKILEAFLNHFGSEENFNEQEGEYISQEETEESVWSYIKNLDLVDNVIEPHFRKNQAARTSCTHNSKGGPAKIFIKIPISYRKNEVQGVWDHEIGTHFIRRYNERFQPWCDSKKCESYGLERSQATEEGVANVNQLIRGAIAKKPQYLYNAALKYYAATLVQEMSFVQLYKTLVKYISDGKDRWAFTMRFKRGMSDTSQHGGYYKDKYYLEGAVEYLQDRKNIDIVAIHASKFSFADIKKPNIMKLVNKEDITLPSFLQNLSEYTEALDFIAECNFISTNPQLISASAALDAKPMIMATTTTSDDHPSINQQTAMPVVSNTAQFEEDSVKQKIQVGDSDHQGETDQKDSKDFYFV